MEVFSSRINSLELNRTLTKILFSLHHVFRIIAKINESHIKTKGQLATFTTNDIKYLIIKTEEERIELIKKIDSIYSSKCPQDDLSLLKSKILTCNQIKEDF